MSRVVLDGVPVDMPRDNGQLVFAAPWEARAFGVVAAYVDGPASAGPRSART